MSPVARPHTAVVIVLVLVCSTILLLPAASDIYEPGLVHDVDALDSGNILVTDGGVPGGAASGIYEIDPDGNIIWSYTADLAWAHNADMQPDSSVVISDTNNDRVIIVDRGGSILWSTDDVTFSDGSVLDYPNDANLLANGNLLITDRDNHRVIEIETDGAVVWQFGVTGVPGTGPSRLNGPHNADRLADGNTIVADSNNNRILEISPAGSIVWSYADELDWPRDADRLASGNTLVNDSDNRRIIEITSAGLIAWEYSTNDRSYDSDRLDSGNTLIGDGGSIIEIDPSGSMVWSYPDIYETEIVEGYLVTAPNGNLLWTKIIQPRADLYPGELFPAIACMTGGLGSGENGDHHVAIDGVIEFHFNAEGRGVLHPSEGEEDCNGFIHQDDFKAVIEFALAQENVDIANVGVVTGSYGITVGAGCLGRYPNLPVKYFIDIEGPSDNFVTSMEPWSLDDDPSNDMHEMAAANFGHWSTYRDSSAANVAWWSEREAVNYIGDITCRYLRVQAEWDHAQPPNAMWPLFDYPPLWYQCRHAVDPVNAAVAGGCPWVRVNGPELGNAVNATYGCGNLPIFYSHAMGAHHGVTRSLILEMVAMPPLTITGTAETPPATTVQLHGSSPNPCTSGAELSYTVPTEGLVRLVIYDLAGRIVAGVVNGEQPAGTHTARWDGTSDGGRPIAAGIYFARLEQGPVSDVRKIVVVR